MTKSIVGNKDKVPSLKKPNWNTWRKRGRCSLADAVALSLGISPNSLDDLEDSDPRRYKIYRARLKSTRLAAGVGFPLSENQTAAGKTLVSKIVELKEFVPYALNSNWGQKLEGFKSLGEVPVTVPPKKGRNDAKGATAETNCDNSRDETTTTGKDLSKDKEKKSISVELPFLTKRLMVAIEAMKKYWSNYDPDSQPKQTAVQQFIDDKLGNQNSPTRTSEEFATMIRPDELRERDRRANWRKR